MNARIKELAMKVSPDMVYKNPHCMEEFAKLIIRECIVRIEPIWPADDVPLNNDTMSDFIVAACRTEYMAEIKQHFGIE